VKHLLIILISILLLSSPVIGDNHKGETLYKWDNPSGDGYIWKGFGDKETQPKYQGDVKNGKPNGLGFMISPDGWKYVGSWENGKYQGQGKTIFSDGSKYVGEYKNGSMRNGTFYNKNGEIFMKFLNGKGKYVEQ